MSPRARAVLAALAAAALCCSGAAVSVARQAVHGAVPMTVPMTVPGAVPGYVPPPAALAARLQALGEAFDGRVGIAVEDVREGWVASYNGSTLFPQQSVAKLWVALAVFKAADRSRVGLSDPVVVRRQDMSVFNQPIQKRLGPDGFATTVDGLLAEAIAKSDNAANDILVRRLGGTAAVRRILAEFRLGALRAGEEERTLECRIAGLSWRPEYSFGRAFWTARDRVPLKVRSARLDAYVVDPDDGATPVALVDGLRRLQQGELLSPAGSARFLQILTSTETGPMRLKAGLGPGWSIAHKTGTGQDLGALSTGYNDVGLLTAPDGHVYAVAVMIGATRRPIPERQALMAAVSRAVVAQHDGRPA